MDKRLQSILKKVVAQVPLSDDDLVAVAAFVGDDTAGSKDGPMPLWFWVRHQTLLNQRWLDFYLDDNVDPVLLDAGAATESLPTYGSDYRPFAQVSKDGLVRGRCV